MECTQNVSKRYPLLLPQLFNASMRSSYDPLTTPQQYDKRTTKKTQMWVEIHVESCLSLSTKRFICELKHTAVSREATLRAGQPKNRGSVLGRGNRFFCSQH